jgi:hypothetical protein
MDLGRPPDNRSGASLHMAAWHIAIGYALLASLATALALALRDGMPWNHPSPWLTLSAWEAVGLSAAGGLGVSLLIVVLTRLLVPRVSWASRLQQDMRPFAHGLSNARILVIACCSSVGEELLFRGLLQPWLGVILSSMVFGLVHQMPGPSRWVWVSFATLMGALLGSLFAATGSLVGPLLAHAIVNAANLAYLRDFAPDPLAKNGARSDAAAAAVRGGPRPALGPAARVDHGNG